MLGKNDAVAVKLNTRLGYYLYIDFFLAIISYKLEGDFIAINVLFSYH